MAEAAIAGLRAAPDEKARAEAWRAAQKDERAAAELGTFREALAQRGAESERHGQRRGLRM